MRDSRFCEWITSFCVSVALGICSFLITFIMIAWISETTQSGFWSALNYFLPFAIGGYVAGHFAKRSSGFISGGIVGAVFVILNNQIARVLWLTCLLPRGMYYKTGALFASDQSLINALHIGLSAIFGFFGAKIRYFSGLILKS